jgi:sugar lactone lactonase YvrE
MTLRVGKAVTAAARAVPLVAALFAVIFGAATPLLRAASTKVWEISEFKDFAPGKFENLSLTYDGRLTLGPSLEPIYSSDQPVIWDTAVAPDGSIYVATGHQGHVYRIDPKGESKLFWDAPEIEVFSIAIAPSGDVYAGTSPNGKIYRITPQGEASEFFNPGETYIWSLEFAPSKSGHGQSKFGGPEALFAGTGEKGNIYRIDPSGQGEVYFDTEQRHVMSLAFDPQGRLLAGTDPNGILYRVDAKGKAFALYDSDLPEVRALQVAPNGDIYAAAMGGGVSETPQAVPTAVTSLGSSAVTTITVNATAEDNPAPDDFQKAPGAAPQGRGQTPIVTVTQPAITYSGIEKAALLRVRPGVAVEKLWSSQEENILALSLSSAPEPELLFATDAAGRIYRLEKERRVSLVAQAEQDQITRLAVAPGGVLLSTAHSGKLYRLGAPPRMGSYQTGVFDSGGVSQWGRLSWQGAAPERSSVRFQTRTGNSGRPDATWSDWSKSSDPAEGADGEAISSPAARYMQWRVELHGNGDGPVTIDKVGVTYLPQNAPPVIHSVDVSTSAASKDPSGSGSSASGSSDGAAAYSVTVSASGNVATPASSSETQTLGGGGRQVVSISWQAEDPDGDPLTAEVHFRGEDETVWKLLKEDIRESKLDIDSDALADGPYRFRVTVSDRRANPPSVAESVSRVSRTILVDHTPPHVRAVAVDGRQAVRFDASDEASLLQQAEYSLDAGSWQPVYPDDGILDSRNESFTIRLADLPPGEHLITLRVRDRTGNAGLGKAVIR